MLELSLTMSGVHACVYLVLVRGERGMPGECALGVHGHACVCV